MALGPVVTAAPEGRIYQEAGAAPPAAAEQAADAQVAPADGATGNAMGEFLRVLRSQAPRQAQQQTPGAVDPEELMGRERERLNAGINRERQADAQRAANDAELPMRDPTNCTPPFEYDYREPRLFGHLPAIFTHARL